MRRSLFAVVLSLVAVASAGASLAGCGTFGADSPAAEADAAPAPTSSPDADAAPGPGPGPGPEADAGDAGDAAPSVDASDGAPPCIPVLESFTSEADTFLVTTGACDGSINQGSATNLNVSSGYLALVRFAWSDAAEAAWAAGQLTSLTLTIDENPTCNGGCAVNHAPGVFSVHPARTDWSEGNGTPYNGADFCRRTTGTGGGTGNGWGIGLVKASSGTSITATVDYGGPSIADFILVASGKKLTFTLPVATARFSMHEPNKIAFLLSGAGSATFFGAARESGTHPAPKLVVGYCP